jgi:ribonuclease VapC
VIIDTSALIAILRAEPDASQMAHAIESARGRCISAANWLETAVVIDASRDPVASRRFDELVQTAELHVEPAIRPASPVTHTVISARAAATRPA